MSELIDNAIAARISGQIVHVKIDIYVDQSNRATKFVISDDASGIPLEKIANAITPAGIQTSGSLNEHGLGMKQAVAALGKLDSLITKTEDGPAFLVPEFKFGEIELEEVELEKPHGTTITIVNLRPIVVTHATSITRSIQPYLGARYRRFLRPERPIMSLTLEIFNEQRGDSLYRWEIKEEKPYYFHPGTRENRPVINQERAFDRIADTLFPGFGRLQFSLLKHDMRFDYLNGRNCGARKFGLCLSTTAK